MCFGLIKTSIGKKQVVALTGLLLIIFVVSHLIGNLLIFAGPKVFNGYAATLKEMRPLILLVELALLAVFLIHVLVTVLLVLENRRSAGFTRYAVANHRGNLSWATQTRTYTGLFLFAFILWHLFDFTFSNHSGPRSIIDHQSLGLYGLVYNSFLNPIHSLLYIIAMGCLGFHLAHGVQSFMQTFGFNHPRYTPMVLRFSRFFALVIAIGFSSIPVYVLIRG